MNKKPFAFSPLKSKIKKYNFIGFDVETYKYKGQQVFYFGGIYYYDCKGNEQYKVYFDKIEFAKELLSPKYSKYIITATNLSFDFTAVFEDTHYFNEIQTIYRGSDLLLCNYNIPTKKREKIKFIDSMNYAPFSVEVMGKILKNPKLEKPEYMGKRKSKTQDELDYFIEYNKQDCKITCDFMYFLQNGVNKLGGTLKNTIASTSLDTYRRSYQLNTWRKEQDVLNDKNIKKFIRSGYYGGRTEVYRRGKYKNLNYYDINSLYPSQMLKSLPLPQSAIYPNKKCVSNIEKFMGVSNVKVKVPSHINKPPLPYRTDKGKLIFPTGVFTGSFNHNELYNAILEGCEVIEINQQLIYRKSFKPFKSFINTLYNQRLEQKSNNDPNEIVTKLLMNSLYGKFGQSKKQKCEITDLRFLTPEKKANALLFDEGDIKGDKMINISEEEYDGVFSFPIISSYITSYARIEMYKYLKQYDVIYTDTDSIVTSEYIEESTELGKMKLESKIIEGEFYKPKMYKIVTEEETNIKVKGVNKCSISEFEKIKKGKEINKEKLSKIRESVRRGIGSRTHILVPKLLNLQDDKRVWHDLNSSPIHIEVINND